MEQRLVETETALYDAISELRRISGNETQSAHSARLNTSRTTTVTKSAKLREWATYPLKSSEDVERWWLEMAEHGHVVPGELRLSPGNIIHLLICVEGQLDQVSQISSRTSGPSFQTAEQTNHDSNLTGFDVEQYPLPVSNASAFAIPAQKSATPVGKLSSFTELRYSNPMPINREDRVNTVQLPTDIYRNFIGTHNQQIEAYASQGTQIYHARQSSQSASAQERRPDSATPATPPAMDESLVLSKHLSSTMQDTYY